MRLLLVEDHVPLADELMAGLQSPGVCRGLAGGRSRCGLSGQQRTL